MIKIKVNRYLKMLTRDIKFIILYEEQVFNLIEGLIRIDIGISLLIKSLTILNWPYLPYDNNSCDKEVQES